MQSTSVKVDGYSVHVPNKYRDEVLAVFEGHGLTPRDLDGRSGDGIEREIAAGSIDGDDPQELATFADVLDTLDQMNTPYHAEVLAAQNYRVVNEYMSTRGRTEIQPTYKAHPFHGRTHDGGFTPGDYEAATSY